MTDPRPICPIPPDAKVGDIVVFKRRGKEVITAIHNDEMPIIAYYAVARDGNAYGSGDYCIAFERANGRKPAKPKRTQAQRDAAWLRKIANDQYYPRDIARMKNIADRLEKQQ